MTSEWLVPSTRSEIIEDLVSGVGQSPFSLTLIPSLIIDRPVQSFKYWDS